MNPILIKKIDKINIEIQKFMSTWAGKTQNILKSNINQKILDNILEPGLDLINRGGKRWRPLLMLLCCEMAGGGERALPFTPIVEIAHNGTLIADDIEDNSEIRRGDKAVHLKYGLDLALNAGNFMCFLPSLIIDQCDLEPARKYILYQYFLEDLRNLHIGQGLDIQWHNNHRFIPAEEEYLLMCRLKTGTLARMAGRLGIIIGGGSEELAIDTGNVCENFGVGFQIIDDVKNLTTGNPGKKPGDDIVEGKKSLPIILLFRDNPQAAEKILEIFKKISANRKEDQENQIRKAIDILSASNCIEKAQETATYMINQACEKIRRNFPASESRSLLLQIFNKLG